MEYPAPIKGKITVYSKSGCINCTKVKTLLKDNRVAFTIIDCDEFILTNKQDFLTFMQSIVGQEFKTFPMVFDNNIFIGGYNDTVTYITRLLDFETF